MIKTGLIVSCQPLTGNEPFYDYEFIKRYALAAEYSKASAIRIEGIENIIFLKECIKIPIIASIKKTKENNLYRRNITPSYEDISKLANADSGIIAVDFTFRQECNKIFYKKLMANVRKNFPKIEICADISTIEEAINAEDCKVDYISSTLVGYTYYTSNSNIPNFEILKEMKKHLNTPIFAEGGFSNETQVREAKRIGIKNIVIGTALTRPHVLMENYNNILRGQDGKH